MPSKYTISGKTTILKRYANVKHTIEAIKRIVQENFQSISDLSENLIGNTEKETFNNIWNYVRQNIRYKNDESGKEQLRTPQRTLHDKSGDCDDMSILISSILMNLNYPHELIVAAYKKKDKWQHIYPVAYDKSGNRYTIDCVPEIPHFNYEAKPIKNQIRINMQLEELGQGIDTEMLEELTEEFSLNNDELLTEDEQVDEIQGLLGNIVFVDENDEYDTTISGSDLKENIILKQLTDAQKALKDEVNNPTELSELNDNRLELELVNNIIENFYDDELRTQVLADAIQKETLYKNFYKAIIYGMHDVIEGLSGDEEDDIYYLKVMQDEGLIEDMDDEEFDDLGRRKVRKASFRDRIKNKIKKFKARHPKLAKIGQALKKYSPATFALRRALGTFMKANVFNMASKLAVGYMTESQATKNSYTRTEWKEFVKAKNKAEKKWYALGGKKSYFKNLIMKSRGARKAGLHGELGVASAVIALVSKAFGAIIGLFKKLKLKAKDGKTIKETADDISTITNKSGTRPNKNNIKPPVNYSKSKQTNSDPMDENENENENIEVDEKSGVVTETIKDESGKETKVYKDKDGNEINKFKAFFLKNKTILIIISIVLVIGIIALIIWKARQSSLDGLGGEGLSRKQENYIKREGLNKRAIASLIREEIHKDGKKNNKTNRKYYYGKVFNDTFSKPLSEKQTSAALSHNSTLKEVRELAKENGGGSEGYTKAWAIVKKKRLN